MQESILLSHIVVATGHKESAFRPILERVPPDSSIYAVVMMDKERFKILGRGEVHRRSLACTKVGVAINFMDALRI